MITAPEEEILTLESVKNQITLGEGELKRLKDLSISETISIQELVKSRRFHQDEVAVLELNKVELENKIKELSRSYNEALGVIKEAKQVLAEQQVEWDKIRHAKDEHEDEKNAHVQKVEAHELKVTEDKSDIQARKEEVSRKEAMVQAREDHIADFVKLLGR